jgi:hypothetical protein
MIQTASAPELARDDDTVRTTLAHGEEDRPPKRNPIEDVPSRRKGEDDQVHTTLALGEEGGGAGFGTDAESTPFGQF